jgi:tetratricopeptide (TPR) repeat protein
MTSNDTPPTLADALAQAVQWLTSGQTEQGRALLLALAEAHPELAEVHLLIAAELAEDQNWDAAEAAFRRATELAPDLLVARFQWGLLVHSRGEFDKAREILLPLQDAADLALAGYARALIHDAEGQRDAARAAMAQALEAPQSIPVLAGDMRRLFEQWTAAAEAGPSTPVADPLAARAFLDTHSKH